MRTTRSGPVPAGFNLDEIFIPGKSTSFESNDSWLSWRKTFVQSDKILKLWDRYGFARIREAAIRKCEHWMLERMKHADGLGAIYPPMSTRSWRSTFWAMPKTLPCAWKPSGSSKT